MPRYPTDLRRRLRVLSDDGTTIDGQLVLVERHSDNPLRRATNGPLARGYCRAVAIRLDSSDDWRTVNVTSAFGDTYDFELVKKSPGPYRFMTAEAFMNFVDEERDAFDAELGWRSGVILPRTTTFLGAIRSLYRALRPRKEK